MTYRIEFYEDESDRKSALDWIRGDLDFRTRHLLQEINSCAHADGIRVCERRAGDNGRALAVVARDPDVSRSRYELVAAAALPGIIG
ncbi:MAG: hypothetical protein ACR2P2_21300 [Nakamurella sp.]